MLTLEQSEFRKVERLALSEFKTSHELSPESAEWIDAFYRNIQGRILNLYDGARLGARGTYDREELAEYWREKLEWFNEALRAMRETKAKVQRLGAPVPPALTAAIDTVAEIVEACASTYELHS
jgi:hypothetical protein